MFVCSLTSDWCLHAFAEVDEGADSMGRGFFQKQLDQFLTVLLDECFTLVPVR